MGSDRLLLWAVAGLTGVVISSGARPGGPRAALRAPRAVLWGQHTGSLAWPVAPSYVRECSLPDLLKLLGPGDCDSKKGKSH